MAHVSRCEKESIELRDTEETVANSIENEDSSVPMPDKLHAGVEGQSVPFYDSFNDPDWRKPRGNTQNPNLSFRARFGNRGFNGRNPGFGASGFNMTNKSGRNRANGFDWSMAKLAAKHLKFCPGETCKEWLPLQNFGSNFNMEDGLDIYCVSCNANHRDDKRGRRNSALKKVVSIDKYTTFKKEHEDGILNETQMREVEKRIRLAAIEARGRFKREIPIKTSEIYRLIFEDDAYVCEVTNEPMTAKCFLDHHSITFEIRTNETNKKVVDVICSDCKRR